MIGKDINNKNGMYKEAMIIRYTYHSCIFEIFT